MSNKTLAQTYNSPTGMFTKTFIGVTTVSAMLAYSAFPLAIFLNKHYFWHGLVSTLAEPGQPHSSLFTTVDITASLFGMAFFSYLSRRENWDRVQSIALRLVVVACTAELLTDLFSLPTHFSTNGGIPSAHYFAAHPSLIVHLVASFVNSAAFIISFGLWVLHRRHAKSKSIAREVIFAITICVGVLGSIIGYVYPAVSPTLQRIFILGYCYWFIAFPYDSLAIKRRSNRR